MLDKSIRCDACGAEAWVNVALTAVYGDVYIKVTEDGTVSSEPVPAELSFCGHHYAKNSDRLEEEGWEVVDDHRELINVKPSVSANA